MAIRHTTIERWAEHLHRDAAGAPLVEPLFALEMGPAVHLVDLREVSEAVGPVGFIPGSVFPAAAALDGAARRADAQPIVLVSVDGSEAAALAHRLESAGAARVAALEGGMAAWRARGFGVTRDTTHLLRSFDPLPPMTLDPSELLTVEALTRFLADPRSTHWVQMASLNFQTTQACVDGRDGRGVVGTPGGDAGELALILTAVEQVSGKTLSEGVVEAALVDQLDAFGDFYLHSDTHALEALHAELRADSRTSGAVPDGVDPDEWLAFLGNPAPAVREALLEHVARPPHVGCGHLRLQLEHPADYGVRPELVAQVIRSFFRLLWAGSPELRLVILEGGHAEGAVLNVRLDCELTAVTPVPVILPSWGGRQTFINHPDVVRATRLRCIRYHAGLDTLPMTTGQVSAVADATNALGDRQLAVTLGHLAAGRGIFEARFSRDRRVEVTRLGQVE